MKDAENEKNRIEDYLLNRLSKKDHQAFQEAMNQDAELKKNVDLQQEIVEGIAAHSRKKLKERLQVFHEEMEAEASPIPNKTIGKRLPLIARAGAAAAIALLVFAAYWLYSGKENPQQLYADFFQARTLELAQRDASDLPLLRLEKLYQNKNYTAALPLFDSLLIASPQNVQLHLGAGISQMETRQYDQALIHFKTILDSGDFLYRDQAIWYTALVHLQLDQLDQSRQFLKLLTDDEEADHHQEALELFKKMNRI